MAIILSPRLTNEERDEYIQGKIDEFSEKIDKEIYLQAKDILNKYFGEENNQISKVDIINVKEFIEQEIGEFNIHSIISMNSSQMKRAWERCNVYIRFPEIKITNGVSDPHIIKDLWIKFQVDEKFGVSNFSGVRSLMTYDEALVGYMHSHLPSYTPSTSQAPKFNRFCTGSGEILQVMKVLSLDGFDVINFTLFCLHLKNYVAWESIEGVPHITYDSLKIGRGVRSLQSASLRDTGSYLPELSISIKRGTVSVLKSIINENDSWDAWVRVNIEPTIINDQVTISYNDNLSIKLAEIITNFNSVNRNFAHISNNRAILCRKLDNDEFAPLDRPSDRVIIREPVNPIFTFKGQPIYLKIEELEKRKLLNNSNENIIVYAHPSITSQFCESFRSDFSEACFRFEKVIKENSLKNLLQTTGSNLLPV